MGLQPGVAKVAVGLVGHRHLLLHHRGCHGGHQVQHQGRREVLGDLELQRMGIERLDEVVHVVLVPAELGEQEGRRLVHDDDALERERHVIGGDRRPALELLVGAQLEGIGLGVGRDRPAFGDAADQLGHVLRLVAHETVIDAGEEDLRRNLVRLTGIAGDDVVDLGREHHDVLRRRGVRGSPKQSCQRRGRCQKGKVSAVQHVQSSLCCAGSGTNRGGQVAASISSYAIAAVAIVMRPTLLRFREPAKVIREFAG